MDVTVCRLTRSQHIADRWYAELSDGETLKVDLNLIADFSLYSGRELTQEDAARLRKSAAQYSARECALRILGTRMLSRAELIRRLTDKGETEENAVAAVDALERAGAVNDAEYASAIVRHYAKSGYGPARIRDELYRRGIPRELWDDALEDLSEDSGETVRRLLRQRLRGVEEPDSRDLKRAADMLRRRGFPWEEIKLALAEYTATEELNG